MVLPLGRILDRYGSPEIGRVSGHLRVMPWTGSLFAAGMIALPGLPPFGMFLSKFTLVRAGFAEGQGWLMLAVLAPLAVAFVSVPAHLNRMLHGGAPADVPCGEGGGGWSVVRSSRASRRPSLRGLRRAVLPCARLHLG